MNELTVPIEIPQPLYFRLKRLADLTHRPLDKIISQTLNATIPPLPDDLPEDMRADLVSLEQFNDEEL